MALILKKIREIQTAAARPTGFPGPASLVRQDAANRQSRRWLPRRHINELLNERRAQPEIAIARYSAIIN
jgi:hypothetical protein